MLWTQYIMAGSVSGALAILFGAFGAHALKSRINPSYLDVFETAVRYQVYHALALIGVGLIATRIDASLLKITGTLFILGTLMFSGSLYALVLSGVSHFGMITPIGGICLFGGWVSLFWTMTRI